MFILCKVSSIEFIFGGKSAFSGIRIPIFFKVFLPICSSIDLKAFIHLSCGYQDCGYGFSIPSPFSIFSISVLALLSFITESTV